MWARIFMYDLALTEGISGEIALYDIDEESAIRNQRIGRLINEDPKAISKWEYTVSDSIETSLKGATFVIISILPGTFAEMQSDVHAPEKYGIYQSVGDTVGPGGVLRAMRTVPIYEKFAKKIKTICPNAWVINLTNPMSICVKTLYDVFPEIKCFGCCHEVFHAQEFLTIVLKQTRGITVGRNDIYCDSSGINHFTWITEAKYGDIDLLKLIPEFETKYYEEGYFERGDRFAFRYDTFAYGNKLKMDLYNRYGALGAAGDRHLAEFMDGQWYLKNPETVKSWLFGLTSVAFRKKQQAERVAESEDLASGKKPIVLGKSNEEAVDLMKALLGFQTIVSNVNMPNRGQMPGFPKGTIVETNCIFSSDCLRPVVSKELPAAVKSLVQRNAYNIDVTYEGIKKRNLDTIFQAFIDQPLCSHLSLEEGKTLFREMCHNTRKYLDEYYDLDSYFLSK